MAHTFDVTFKYLFQRQPGVLARLLFGEEFEWQSVEQPEVRSLRADLLAKSGDGTFRHVELQVTNDRLMGLRMLEYYVGFYRALGTHVQQTVLYAGREPLRMESAFETASTRHTFSILNLREMDGEVLLASEHWADNEWALLTKTDPEKVIRVVMEKLRTLSGAEQEVAASTFVIIGGILGIEGELERRLRTEMINLLENKVLGPAIRQGLEQGLREGRSKGMAEALRTMLEKRFGRLPAWAQTRLGEASPDLLNGWILRLDEANTLEQILS